MSETNKSGLTILYVEDMKDAFMLVNIYLRSGFNVLWAKSPEEANEILEKVDVNLILMDISLQEKNDGFELAKKIKVSEKFGSIPIVALTAFALKGDKERFLEGGLDDYISKPIKKDFLIETIKKHINLHTESPQ